MNKALGYERLRRHGRAFRRLTGVTPAVFEEIIERVASGMAQARTTQEEIRPVPMAWVAWRSSSWACSSITASTPRTCSSAPCSASTIPPSAGASPFSTPLVAGAVALKKDRARRQDDLETLLIDATEQPIRAPSTRAAPVLLRQEEAPYPEGPRSRSPRQGASSPSRSRFPAPSHDIEVRRRGPPLSAWSARLRGQRIPGLAETPRADGTALQAAKGSAAQRRREGLQPRPLTHPGSRWRTSSAASRCSAFSANATATSAAATASRFNIIAGIVNLLMGF